MHLKQTSAQYNMRLTYVLAFVQDYFVTHLFYAPKGTLGGIYTEQKYKLYTFK